MRCHFFLAFLIVRVNAHFIQPSQDEEKFKISYFSGDEVNIEWSTKGWGFTGFPSFDLWITTYDSDIFTKKIETIVMSGSDFENERPYLVLWTVDVPSNILNANDRFVFRVKPPVDGNTYEPRYPSSDSVGFIVKNPESESSQTPTPTPTPTPSPSSTPSPSETPSAAPPILASKSKLGAGAIAGIVIGVLVGVALLCGIVFFVLRRSRKNRMAKMEATEKPETVYSGHNSEIPALASHPQESRRDLPEWVGASRK